MVQQKHKHVDVDEKNWEATCLAPKLEKQKVPKNPLEISQFNSP